MFNVITFVAWFFRLNVCIPCLSTPVVSISHKKTMCAGFPFFWFFFYFCMLIWILVKPNFDQDLNKFQTWKWKTKPGFLSHSKMKLWWGFWNFSCSNPKSLHIHSWLYSSMFNVTTFDAWFFRSNVCRSCLSTSVISVSHKKTVCAGFPFFWFCFEFYMLILNSGQT